MTFKDFKINFIVIGLKEVNFSMEGDFEQEIDDNYEKVVNAINIASIIPNEYISYFNEDKILKLNFKVYLNDTLLYERVYGDI